MDPHARAERMFFRYTKKKDSERFRTEFSKVSELEATQEQSIIDQLVTKPTTITRPALATSPEASTGNGDRGKRTPPQGNLPSKLTPTKRAKIGGIQAGLTIASEVESGGEQNPKKYAAEAEKAMTACIASLVQVTGQANEVKSNMEKFSEWSWIQDTKFYLDFLNAIRAIEEYKRQNSMVRSALIAQCDLGHVCLKGFAL